MWYQGHVFFSYLFNFQVCPQKCVQNYRNYSEEQMTAAYNAVKDRNVPVAQAAREHGVPDSTLRDRVDGRVGAQVTRSGPKPLFNKDEEKKMVDHVVGMANMGIGYTRTSVVQLATDSAKAVGKSKTTLSMKWYYSFINRWKEDIKLQTPRALDVYRAKGANPEAVRNYYNELEKIMTKYSLTEKPEKIFNIDEKGICMGHTPPKIVGGKDFQAPALTTPRGQTVTMIAASCALGNVLPPFFVFPGKRLTADLIKGGLPGTGAAMSDSGWSNTSIFDQFMKSHFTRYVQGNGPYLVLYDGHRSHVNKSLIDWARERGYILFVLPPHTSHLLQPLDLGCFGPFARMYGLECQAFLKKNVGRIITRNDICSLAGKAYGKTLTPNNIRSSFRAAGIYPLNKDVVPPEKLAPSKVFISYHHL